MKRLYLFATLALLATISGAVSLTGAEARSPAAAAQGTTSVRIYLVAIGGSATGQKFGCGDGLVGVTLPVASTTAPLSAALRLLLANHQRFYGQSGLYNALYRAHLSVNSVRIQRGHAIIHLAGRLSLGGECDNPRVEAQLKRIAFQFPTVHGVFIYINNVPLKKVLSLK